LEHLSISLLRWRELHYNFHDKETGWLKGERHDPNNPSPELLEAIREMAEAGKTAEFIRARTGLAYRTVERIAANQGLTLRKNNCTDDQLRLVVERHGGLNKLIARFKELRAQGIGWHRIAEIVGLNRYACKVLAEEGRVPSLRNCGRTGKAEST
jgi:hypothetical protein